ncbi:MAG TPA: hypothetical protein VGI38_11385 [Puia sp.]|jgi:hypothetical protein
MKKHGISIALCLLLHAVCVAQIPVSQESRHHKILENDHVRLLDVHIPPGDTSLFHIHATPSVFLILHNVKTGSQVISEEDHSKSPIPHFGDMWFEGFYVKPRIHRVWNSDSSEFHVMDIELTNKNYITIDGPVKQAPFTFLFDEKPVRAYRLDLSPATDISIAAGRADVLMILLKDSVSSVQANKKDFQKKGDFLYVSSGTSIEVKNKGGTEATFAFFELK